MNKKSSKAQPVAAPCYSIVSLDKRCAANPEGKCGEKKRPGASRCTSCNRPWVKHHGIIRTCAALQVAMEVLGQLADASSLKSSRSNARAAVAFLETQLGPR